MEQHRNRIEYTIFITFEFILEKTKLNLLVKMFKLLGYSLWSLYINRWTKVNTAGGISVARMCNLLVNLLRVRIEETKFGRTFDFFQGCHCHRVNDSEKNGEYKLILLNILNFWYTNRSRWLLAWRNDTYMYVLPMTNCHSIANVESDVSH